MQSMPTPERPPNVRPAVSKPTAIRSNASVRDSVRVLTEVVSHLNERIELLEARELLYRAR
jgi:hypothetical protein